MFLKDLRKLDNERLLERLNKAQHWYNMWVEVNDRYNTEYHLRTITNCKKVFAERNIKIDFINGWEMI